MRTDTILRRTGTLILGGLLLVGGPAALADTGSGPLPPVPATEDTANHPREDAQRILGAVGRVLDGLVDEGAISADQRDLILDRLAETVRRARAPRAAGRFIATAAAAAGVGTDELIDAVHTHGTVTAALEALGADPAAVQEALVADGLARLDAAVADGRIDQEQADRIAAGMAERVHRWMNTTRESTRPDQGPARSHDTPARPGRGPVVGWM